MLEEQFGRNRQEETQTKTRENTLRNRTAAPDTKNHCTQELIIEGERE